MNEPRATALAWPFVAGPAEAPRQPIAVTWRGSAPPTSLTADGVAQPASWVADGGGAWQALAYVPLSEGERTVELTVVGDADGPAVALTCPVAAPRHWELFIVPHSHVDIGYTEYQDLLADAHGDYIAQALDLITATDGRPQEERYRWTCEASWTVEQFLRRHPTREAEFARRLREGRMELTALYVNMTDLFGERMLQRAVEYAVALRDRYGVSLVSACNYDVNGFGWAVPAVLQRAGVRYLDTAINETRALGVRPRPAALRWASPDGSTVLLWHSASYLIGNTLLLHKARVDAEPRVAEALLRWQREGYPHDAMQLLISGVSGDSMPPSGAVCDVVADWNRAWLWPRLRLATVREWFEHLEAHWPEQPVLHQGAWPDWWADGNGSALYEAALVRATQARLTGLAAQRRCLEGQGIALGRLDEQYEAAWRRAMLFCEHTWGPYETALAPDSAASRGQWANKAGHAYAAAALADSLEREQMVAAATTGRVSARDSGLTNATLQGAPSGYLASGDPPAVLVFNPLPERRSDVLRVHVPGHFSGWAPPALRDAHTGQPVAARVLTYPLEDVVNRRHYQVEFRAEDLPPEGHRAYLIEPGGDQPLVDPPPKAERLAEGVHYRVEVDGETGAVRSIVHRASGRQIVQSGTGYLLNQALYEEVAAPEGRNAVASWAGRGNGDTPFARTCFSMTDCSAVAALPGAQALRVRATGPRGMVLLSDIVLYDAEDRVDIINTLSKPPVEEAEALYHAFPLGGGDGQIYLQVAGGVMRPGLDQVPGTATDWHSVQEWFAVAEADHAIVVASPDVPLVQCTGINTGLWRPELPPSNGLVFSWAMNNYWFTNFPVRQGGTVTYSYSLTLQEGPFDAARAAQFGNRVRHRAWGAAVRLSESAAALLG